MRLVIEEQKGTQFKGYLINSADRIESRVPLTGAIDLKNEYLYLRLGSGDVCVGQITTGNCLILFVPGSSKDTATVFKLRKTAAP